MAKKTATPASGSLVHYWAQKVLDTPGLVDKLITMAMVPGLTEAYRPAQRRRLRGELQLYLAVLAMPPEILEEAKDDLNARLEVANALRMLGVTAGEPKRRRPRPAPGVQPRARRKS